MQNQYGFICLNLYVYNGYPNEIILKPDFTNASISFRRTQNFQCFLYFENWNYNIFIPDTALNLLQLKLILRYAVKNRLIWVNRSHIYIVKS